MAYDYGFGELGNKLIDACKTYPPNFESIKEILESGIDLNISLENAPDENLLSEIIMCCPGEHEACNTYNDNCDQCTLDIPKVDGRYLPEIIKLFLQYGFDCSKNNGLAGLSCLENLTWSSYDKYILDAAKLLLDYGVDPEGSTEPPETVMEWVYTKAVANVVIHNDIKQANLFFTMHEILNAKVKGEDYALIEHYDRCIGRHIDQVVLYGDNVEFREIGESSYYYQGTLVFWCEGIPLCMTEEQELYINPNIPQKALHSKVVDDYFKDCIGSLITAIDFGRDVINQCACQQTILKMNNGTVIKFQFNAGEVPIEEIKNYCKVISENN